MILSILFINKTNRFNGWDFGRSFNFSREADGRVQLREHSAIFILRRLTDDDMMYKMGKTSKKQSGSVEAVRHSLAHLLAYSVKQLYPGSQNAIGPAIENGFYQDFEIKGVVGEEDLPKIEKKMREVLKSWKRFDRKEVKLDEALKIFADNKYKQELAREFAKGGKKLTIYTSGNFIDLCRGGHVDDIAEISTSAFKLTKTAGAYWRGDEKNIMLTRIYGVAFSSQEELDHHLQMLEEAKKRDHRKLGESLDLFAQSNDVGLGLILWLPKGTTIKEEIENLGKEIEARHDYQRVSTPHIAKEELFYTSGHLPYFKDEMYPPMKLKTETYYLKPMNCPPMHMIYKSRQHSYRDLPIRYAEFGAVYRYEDSGALMGLMRVRGMTQNDAHIYCTEEQAVNELVAVMELHKYYYELFNITDYYVELALPDLKGKPDKYFDDPVGWDKAIAILRQSAKKTGIKAVEKEGEAAFYGPKFDFNVKSAVGREFGASTNQLDFGSGKRFNLTYADKDGKEKNVPYIIHRAPLGSDERFIGFLIEHYGGAFPIWLAPEQIRLLTVNQEAKTTKFAGKILDEAKRLGLRVSADNSNESVGKKIRNAETMKIPYTLVIGEKEIKSGKVTPRVRNDIEVQKTHKAHKVEDFLKTVANEAKSRVSKTSL